MPIDATDAATAASTDPAPHAAATSAAVPAAVPAASPAASPAPLDTATPILIADDQVIVATILRAMLNGLGFTDVEHVTDGFEAMTRLYARGFGLALVDIGMAPMNGLQLLRAMQGEPRLRRVPTILVTSSRDPGLIGQARAALVKGVLTKPFAKEALREVVTEVLGLWGPGASEGEARAAGPTALARDSRYRA